MTTVNGSGYAGTGLTQPKLVRTLEQSPECRRHGSDRETARGPRRLANETQSLPTAIVRPDATRRWSRGQGQADLPAEQPAPGAGPRLPATDAYPCGSRYRVRPAPQGPPLVDCLIRTGIKAVLPTQYRMTRSAEFGATVKYGVRAVQPDIVVHVRRDDQDAGGPRIGLVVTKSVGSAVQRHRVSRRLRHVARAVIDDLDPVERVVVRALPSSRRAISARLEQQLRAALQRSHQMMEKGR